MLRLNPKTLQEIPVSSRIYDVMSMMGDAEAEFDIEIDQEEAVKCKTVGELADYFEGLAND